MNLDQLILDAETRIFKAVFPNTTNHYDTLFGGTAMHLMDEVALSSVHHGYSFYS
jgi:acyl-CoA hydrolase